MELFEDASFTDDPTLVGEEAHIIAREDDGPRGDPAFPVGKRDLYGNLILLCCNHHKLVDTDVSAYSVDVLLAMKATHEQWVRESLSVDQAKLRDDERYAVIADEWALKADLENWNGWTSWLMGAGQPQMTRATHERLTGLQSWLFGQIFPRRHQDVEAAWECFRRVLNDLLYVFDGHSEEVGSEDDRTFWIEKCYKHARSRETERQLLGEYEAIVYLVEDLTVELTRAANITCDLVRRHVDPTFRLADGHLLVTRGPDMDLTYTTYKPEYPPDTTPGTAYPGLKEFKVQRFTRALHFGNPGDNDYLAKLGESPMDV